MNSPTDAAPALPVWVRVADGVTILCGVVALNIAVFGGIRVETLFSMSTPFFVLVVVCGLRHDLVRTPPLHRRLWNGLRGGWRDEAVSTVWPIVVVTRLAVLLVGYLAVVSIGYASGGPPFRWSDNEVVNLPLRWDTAWYLDIALNGYDPEANDRGERNIAFFPGYPLVTKGVANLLGAQGVFRRPSRLTFVGAALLVSLLSFAWSMVWLYRLAREHLDEEAARGALLLLAAYPFAVFFSAAYSESLMLLAVVGAFYHLKHRKWIQAAVWALLAGLTRPNGFLLALPLAVIATQQLLAARASSEGRGRVRRYALAACVVCAMPVVGMGLYSMFINTITGDPFAWLEAHSAWGRGYTGISGLLDPFDRVSARGIGYYTPVRLIQTLNVLAVILAGALVWPVTRRFGAAYGLFMLLNVAPPLLFGGYLSIGRVTSLLFPMFMYLGLVLANRQRQVLITGFACVQGLAAVLFFTWHRFL